MCWNKIALAHFGASSHVYYPCHRKSKQTNKLCSFPNCKLRSCFFEHLISRIKVPGHTPMVAIFTKGNNFCDFLFIIPDDEILRSEMDGPYLKINIIKIRTSLNFQNTVELQ